MLNNSNDNNDDEDVSLKLAYANYIVSKLWGEEGIKVKDVFPIKEGDWKPRTPEEENSPKKKSKRLKKDH